MGKQIGIKLPEGLFKVIEKGVLCILSTFSEQGVPRSTPIIYIYPKSIDTLLITIPKDHTSYHDMVWQKKVTLTFIEDSDISYSVLGRAGVMRAPSLVHPFMNIIRIDVMDVRSDRSVLYRVEHGIKWQHNSLEAHNLYETLIQELKDLCKIL